jgi:two-component system LytT family response regulator
VSAPGGAPPPLRALVVDDEPLARELLAKLLAREGVHVVGLCADGLEAIEAIRVKAPDLVLLDVEMPGVDGFDVVEAVGAQAMPPVVFVTAHAEHALRAFQVHALDYILKPISEELFAESFQIVRSRLQSVAPETLERALHALVAEHSREHYRRRFLVRKAERLEVVPVDEVDLLEAAANYVRLHCGDRSYLFRGALGALERELDPAQFQRVHRGLIVRIDRVRTLQRDVDGELVLTLEGGRTLSVLRRYTEPLRRALGG